MVDEDKDAGTKEAEAADTRQMLLFAAEFARLSQENRLLRERTATLEAENRFTWQRLDETLEMNRGLREQAEDAKLIKEASLCVFGYMDARISAIAQQLMLDPPVAPLVLALDESAYRGLALLGLPATTDEAKGGAAGGSIFRSIFDVAAAEK